MRDFSFQIRSLGQKFLRGALVAIAFAGSATVVSTTAEAQLAYTRHPSVKTEWSNFGVCPDQTVCKGGHRIGGGTTSPAVAPLNKPSDIGMNRNYVLLVLVTAEYSSPKTTFVTTATYGGKTVTPLTTSDGSSLQKTWIGWVSEADIVLASGTPPNVSVAIDTADLRNSAVYAAYFTGVHQGTPAVATFSDETDTASPTIAFSVAYAAKGFVLYATNANNNPTATPPAGYREENEATEGTGQDQFQISVGTFEAPVPMPPTLPEGGTSAGTVTLSSSERWAVSVVSLQPAQTATNPQPPTIASIPVRFPKARMCVAPCTTILWNGKAPGDFMADGGGPLEDFTSSTTVSQEVEISSGGTKTERIAGNCNPGCPYPADCETEGTPCLCNTGEGSCGPEPSAMYSYYYDSTKNMGYLYGRMRIAKQPTSGSGASGLGSGFLASHWNLLVSFDNDAFKEFWVDVNGNCANGDSADCVNVYYWNGNNGNLASNTTENELQFPTNQINNTCNTPGRVNSGASADQFGNCTITSPAGFITNRVNRFVGCTDDSQTNGPGGQDDCKANSVSRAIYVGDTTEPGAWYVEVQVPIASLTPYNGENPAGNSEGNLGFPGPQTPPTFTWDPNRSDTIGPRTDDAFDFYPLIQSTPPGMLQSPPYGGSGPFSYAPSTDEDTPSAVPMSVPTYLRLNYATCQSATDPLQKDFLFPGNSPSDTTPVTLARFKSAPAATGYRVDWTTVNEVGHAGFDLMAAGPYGWVKVNEEPISAQGIDPMRPQDYSIDIPFGAATAFILVDIDVAGRRQEHGPFKAGEEFGGGRPADGVDWAGVLAEHGSKSAARRAAAQQKAAGMSSAAKAATEVGTPPGLAGYPELRLKVKKDGVYRVTYEALVAAGVDLAGVPPALISLESRTGSVPVRVESGKGQAFGPGSFVEFYGEAVKSSYTETNVYRLAVNPRSSDNVQRDPAPAGKAAPAPWYLEKAEVHRNVAWTPISPLADPWRDDRIVANGKPTSRTYTVGLDDVVPSGSGASVSVGIWGETQKNHVQVFLNGTQNMVADSTFTWNKDATITASVNTGLLRPGANTITLLLPMDHGNRFEIDNVDRYSITYPRAFLARSGSLAFTAAGDAFKVGRLADSAIVVYRITGKKVELLTGATVSGTKGAYEVTFRGSSEPARYVVSTESALLTPELVPVPETNDPTIGSAQYLVISHPDFVDELDDLVNAKEAQGLSVKVVDVTDVYERFSFGVFDPQAIKEFVAQQAEMGTEYVLLVGGDSFDYLGYMTPRTVSFIPTFYVRSSPTVTFAPSDGIFADLDGDRVADLPIGRLPVRSAADLKAVLDKTLSYAPGARSAVFAADQKTAADNYAGICDQTADALGAGWSVTKAYVDTMGVKNAKNALVSAINAGTAFTTFVGHSDVTFWSFLQLFTTADVPKLLNTGAPTVVSQWGCWNTFFAHPTMISLGDKFLVTPGRGAAAVIGPSALSESDSDLLLAKALSVEFAKGGTIGRALTAARARVNAENPGAIDVLRATNLLGDPALVLP